MQAEVLAVLRRHDGPVSAYQVLKELRNANPKLAPPTINRALAGLTERGQVRRLESLNAYIPRQCVAHQGASILSICNDCGIVEERVAPDVLENLSSILGKSGFAPTRHVIEVHGVCATCEGGKASA